MPPRSNEDLPALSLKAQWLPALLGLVCVLFFLDGLAGFGQRVGLPVLLLLVGLCGIVAAAYRGKLFILSAAGLVLSASLVGCLLVECIIRLFLAEPKIPSDERGFEKRIMATWLQPVELQACEGVVRILGVCDSFGLVEGENNYQYLVASQITGQGITAELVNLSISGAHPLNELELMCRFAARFHPDLVLHGLFVGNDFIYPKSRTVEVVGIPVPYRQAPGNLRPQFLLLFQWIRGEFTLLKEAFLTGRERQMGLPSAMTSERAFLWTESKYIGTCQKDAPQLMEWPRTLECIHQIQEETTKMGARYVMVIHPDQCQIDTVLRDRVIQEYHLNPGDFDLDLPQRYLKEDCEQRGIPCLDLLPAFREQGEKGGLYHFRDTHWNEAGNHLAAEGIVEFLLSRGLVPRPDAPR